ncbi:transcriptional regulator [Xanthomonas phaseoli]|uniref:helix-turn-helix domain-containing protein n=1 Tax=Xanthomonas TaxID=338 RepID=UPI0009ACE336|nr:MULTISPECIES: transcriptional regulator [Xanthomonas]MCC4618089.1 transcriptional regulator [Xanthomonas campestris pv. asclepiadis]MCC8531371.1 transcriptional regulator [Xanthomonas phaseoli]
MTIQNSAVMQSGLDHTDGRLVRKVTLRSDKVEVPDLPDLTAEELVEIRNGLRMSRTVFAKYLRTNARTLEGWEQGRARPNAQAVTLIRLVQKHPETVEYLAGLS